MVWRGPGPAAGACNVIEPPKTDFWLAGIVPRPITEFLQPAILPALEKELIWLPDPGPWRYLADPFGLCRPLRTHVFVEAFDYRTKHAVIEHHEFGPDLAWRGKAIALARPFHLSFPFIIEDRGTVFMIPESFQAGEIALYRAHEFPHKWVRETALLPDTLGADAAVLRHEGRWWMFFTIVGPHARDQRELHVAYADNLTGPWKLHAQNPVLNDRSGARPGGTPFHASDGVIVLPVQDCSLTYGGAVRFARFARLEPGHITIGYSCAQLTGDLFSATHHDGCHTLAKCGDLTLVDVKRVARTWQRSKIDLQRHIKRLGYGQASHGGEDSDE